MNSSISSSERGGERSGASYVALVLLVLIGLVAGLEVSLRAFPGLAGASDARYVRKVLEEPGRDVIIGDSHLLPVGEPEGWINLSRAGYAPMELGRALATRLKFHGIDRVVIESGPQILMGGRQSEFRALPPETLTRQIFPVPVLSVEPSLVEPAFKTVVGAVGAVVPAARADEIDERDVLRPAPGPGFARARAKLQNPVPNYRRSAAWRHHWEIVERLVAAGVEVCLVQAPVMGSYLKAARREGMRYFPALADLREEAARRAVRYVAAEELASDYPDAVFGNADHLSREGAALFWTEVTGLCFPDT